jgi:hypothetical protein
VRSSARGRELAVRTAQIFPRRPPDSFCSKAPSAIGGLLVSRSRAGWRSGSLQPGDIFRIEETARLGPRVRVAAPPPPDSGAASTRVPERRRPSESLKGSVASFPDRRRLLRSASWFPRSPSPSSLRGNDAFRGASPVLEVDPKFDPENLLVVRCGSMTKVLKGGAHQYYSALLRDPVASGGVPPEASASHGLGRRRLDRPFWRDGEPRPAGGGPGVGG